MNQYIKNIQQRRTKMVQLNELIRILRMSTPALYNELKKKQICHNRGTLCFVVQGGRVAMFSIAH